MKRQRGAKLRRLDPCFIRPVVSMWMSRVNVIHVCNTTQAIQRTTYRSVGNVYSVRASIPKHSLPHGTSTFYHVSCLFVLRPRISTWTASFGNCVQIGGTTSFGMLWPMNCSGTSKASFREPFVLPTLSPGWPISSREVIKSARIVRIENTRSFCHLFLETGE